MITSQQEKGSSAENTGAHQTSNTNSAESKENRLAFQAIADRSDAFKRLERAFDSVGWNLFYLDGEACLAVERRWQLNKVCPDLRSAAALLKMIGGAI